MNKKIVALFLFAFCVISVVAIGVFGKVPDPASLIPVDEISFIDRSRADFDFACELNEDGDKIIYIERENDTYQLNWRISPQDATDQSVSFVILSGAEFISIDAMGLITFTKEVSITVRIHTNPQDNRSDVINIEFIGNPTSGEENPF